MPVKQGFLSGWLDGIVVRSRGYKNCCCSGFPVSGGVYMRGPLIFNKCKSTAISTLSSDNIVPLLLHPLPSTKLKLKLKWVKLFNEPQLRAMECHLPYEITHCYLPADTVNTPRLTPARQAGTRWLMLEGWRDVSSHRWLVPYWDGLHALWQSPIQVLTRPSVDQLCWSRPKC